MHLKHSRSIIIIGFAIVLVTLLVAGVSGVSHLNQFHERQQQLDSQFIAKRDLLATMLSASRERAIALTMLTNLDDPFKRDEQMLHYNAMGSKFAGAREALLAMRLTVDERDYLQRQGHAVGEGLPSQYQVIELANAGKFEEARDLLTEHAIPTQQQVFTGAMHS
jgi:hypothetical protein